MTTKIPVELSSTPGIVDGSNATAITINSSEQVGIGTTSPSNKFVIAEGTNQHGIEFAPGTLSYIQAYDRATSDYGDLTIDAETIRFGTNNGAERMRIDASGNVGIGITSPAQTLHVNGTAHILGIAAVNKSINSVVALTVGSDSNTTSSYSIEACNNAGATRFIVDGVGNSRFFGSDNSETGRFSSDGKLGIGTTSPTHLLETSGDSTWDNIHFKSNYTVGSGLSLDATNGGGNWSIISQGGGGGAGAGNLGFHLTSNGGGGSIGYKLTIQDTGGISFNGDTAAANALDDYEEGTFTPSFTIGSGSVSYTKNEGSYTKVGGVVNISIAFQLSGISSPSGANLSISGLPFNAGNGEKFVASVTFGLIRSLTNAFDNVRGYINNNASTITISDNSTSSTYSGINANALQATTLFYLSATYNTDE